ncbi:MAG: type IV secretory system conjugative DNA transfer family protein [Bacteroidetes bacterium]|nr:type IV secretory system conjugative DNA transfer family protein [Bacteroidota bacterium]
MKIFRHEKTALFVRSNVNQMKYFGPLSSIFFEQFFDSIMKEIPSKDALPIFFLLDESSSLFLQYSQ